jgi:hypothetical protein
MKASWFKKQGYKKVDKTRIQVLLWKPFTTDAVAPKSIKQQTSPQPIPGKVLVTAFLNGWCPAMNITYERSKKAAAEFGDRVVFEGINTFDQDVFKEWGISDAVFIDGKNLSSGPPPSYEKIKKRIAKKVKKLR